MGEVVLLAPAPAPLLRRVELVSLGSAPTIRAARSITLIDLGVFAAAAGVGMVSLGGALVIPLTVPAAAAAAYRVINIYTGVAPVGISEFSFFGVGLLGGALYLSLVEW